MNKKVILEIDTDYNILNTNGIAIATVADYDIEGCYYEDETPSSVDVIKNLHALGISVEEMVKLKEADLL